MKKVIINADDFGYSSAVNQGIIKSFKDGLLSSTTLMGNMPGKLDALLLAKKNPELGVGIHLVLTCGKPLTTAETLTDDTGAFYNLEEYKKHRQQMAATEIFQEWCAQIDFLLANGLNPTHMDSHHHVHTFPENLEITQRISDKYHLTFRNAYDLEKNIPLHYQKGINGFADLMNFKTIRDMSSSFEDKKEECLAELRRVLENNTEQEITELMVHPAFVDEGLYFHSSFNLARMKEVEILCDSDVKKLFDEFNLEIVNYRDILPNEINHVESR